MPINYLVVINQFYTKIISFKIFLGKKVWQLFNTSILIGISWFLVESSFIFVLQGFLRSINLIESKDTFLPSFYPTTPLGAIGCLLAYTVLRSIVSFFKFYFSDLTNQTFVKVQRQRVLSYALSMAKDVSSHSAVNIFGERIYQAATVIQLLSLLMNSIVVSVLLFTLGLWLAPIELLTGSLCLLVFFIPLRVFNNKISSFGKQLVDHSKVISKVLLLGLRNAFLLRIYNLAEENISLGREHIEKYERVFKQYSRIASLKVIFPQFIGGFIISIICLISYYKLSTTPIQLLSFIYIFMRLAQNLSEANYTLANVRLNFENFTELYKWNKLYNDRIHALTEDLSSAQNFESITEDCGIKFELKNVSFSYPNQHELFSGINLNFHEGDIVLISGRSGSGKSTLLTLLLGVEKPTEGEVLINNKNVLSLTSWLSQHVSYVGPDSYIIEGSIRDNLLYAGNRKLIEDKEMWKSLSLAQLDKLFSSTNLGLDRVLKDATDLSTGQKQRLALARALLRDPKLLILDEATANLDVGTEKEIINVIKSLSKNMIILIISHKDSFDSIITKKINIESYYTTINRVENPESCNVVE